MTMGGSATTQAYGEASYWNKRYAEEETTSGVPFDWYQKYPSIAPLLHLYIPPTPQQRILVVGCGNSALSEGMVGDGYEDVVNIDISSVVIEAMQKKYCNNPKLKYIEMDVRDMSAFEMGSFDAIVDKGTLDSLLCGHNSRQNAAKMLEEVGRYIGTIFNLLPLFVTIRLATVFLLDLFILKQSMTNYRVLKDKGVYILITYGAPSYRLRLLRDSCPWTIKLHVIDKGLSRGSSERPMRELTSPVPLEDDGSSVESVLGKNSDVHYIYACVKEES